MTAKALGGRSAVKKTVVLPAACVPVLAVLAARLTLLLEFGADPQAALLVLARFRSPYGMRPPAGGSITQAYCAHKARIVG